MRGKAVFVRHCCVLSRITPAYAGKRPMSGQTVPSNWDHPRLCGEKDLTKDALHWYKGSPPPMRGKETLHCWRKGSCRITPAYAGKSVEVLCGLSNQKDHPRLCGEKLSVWAFTSFSVGSPPPMRGKVFGLQVQITCRRITPAYAGKSRTLYAEAKNYEDHPRLCGEK